MKKNTLLPTFNVAKQLHSAALLCFSLCNPVWRA